MELSDELYVRVEELSETGNEAMENEDYAKAISCFQKALDILPEPKEDWEAYLWLAGSIGDAYFMMRNYGKSLEFSANVTISERQTILSYCCVWVKIIWNWRMRPMLLNFFSVPICSKEKNLQGRLEIFPMAVQTCESQTKIIKDIRSS